MKIKNMFLKMHFTSLSPDSNNISLAIISDCNKSINCEFSDFDINRCDDWVKDNVISKTHIGISTKLRKEYLATQHCITDKDYTRCIGDTKHINKNISTWLSQFSDYKLNFIVDCGWFTWYKFVELIAEWESINLDIVRCDTAFIDNKKVIINKCYLRSRTGLPKLPANFSPVPQDLNELIAAKKGISVSEAFDWGREQFYFGLISGHSDSKKYDEATAEIEEGRFNSLWDAKVTKAIYEELV